MKLIPRKRLDIGVADLLAGLALCGEARDGASAAAAAEAVFGGELREACMACFSVRSAFDLALQAMELKPGDEVLMSAFNIPHMAELVRLCGALPVPVDLDPETMAPRWAQLQAAITPRTRAIVVAHLFGARFDVSRGVALASERGLFFVEDAAQAFAHDDWRGHPDADISLFSFGPLKTATALGSGVAIVREPELLARMRQLNADYPQRTNLSFARKLLKYLVLRVLTVPRVYGAAAAMSTTLRMDFDATINAVTRSFRGSDLRASLRWRPAPAQLGLMRRRLERPGGSRVLARTLAGARVGRALPASLTLLGGEGDKHAHWLFPVLCEQPEQLISHLRRAGFDATRGGTTLSPIRNGERVASQVEDIFKRIVYLPVDGHLSQGELTDLMAQLDAFAFSVEADTLGTQALLAWSPARKGAAAG
ncbi:MAG: aminotransferase class V-fold PLP-dependent enzyme [Acidiferrobacterales bacterium]